MSIVEETPGLLGLWSGCLSPSVMTAIHVGVRSRSPRDWSDSVASDSGRFLAGDWWGCCRVTLCGSRSPSIWSTLGTFRPCSRNLIPGPRRLGDLGRVGQSRVLGRSFGIEVRAAYAVRVAMPRPAGCLGGVSRPSSRDASSKATPVYHPRG
jgi:hypothetical protein